MSRHIGIVGVSAEGASLCYRTICAEGRRHFGEHGHPEVTMHTYALSAYMDHIHADRWDEVGRLLRASAEILVRAGADLLICPDNTVHQAVGDTGLAATVPWIHIADAVADAAAARGYRRLGILGTRYLMEGPVYRTKLEPRGIAWAIPASDRRRRINEIIFGELVYGKIEARARSFFYEVIDELGGEGCDAVVLGCTEIPLLVEPDESPLPVLDSTRLLARAALEAAAGATPTTRERRP